MDIYRNTTHYKTISWVGCLSFANINDLSMIGEHDSKVAMIVEDRPLFDRTIDGL